MSQPLPSATAVTELERVTVRFAGDSGDGMQLTGTQFTTTSAIIGNDVSTFPDFPAEIRAPAGTLPGVSGFQIQFGSVNIRTPGDTPDVLSHVQLITFVVRTDDKGDELRVRIEGENQK